NEWNADTELQWDLLQWETHGGIKQMVSDLNALVRSQPALHEIDFGPEGFEWIDCHSRGDSVLAYIRKGKNPDDILIVACNFTPVVREKHVVGVPRGGWYKEVFNSDSKFYGGPSVGNSPGVQAEDPGWHMRPYKLPVKLPPLAVVVFHAEEAPRIRPTRE